MCEGLKYCMYVCVSEMQKQTFSMYMYVHAYIYPSRFASTVRTVRTVSLISTELSICIYFFLLAASEQAFWLEEVPQVYVAMHVWLPICTYVCMFVGAVCREHLLYCTYERQT
jgi:hypothetical protein